MRTVLFTIIMVFLLGISLCPAQVHASETSGFGDTGIRLVIDGRDISASVAPMIINARTVVPVRVISEELGADVFWDDLSRTVFIQKGNRSVRLRIDKYLVEYTVDGLKSYGLSDITPKIYSDRTFVPLRLISNALGVGIDWDEITRTVNVDSDTPSDIVSFFNMKLESVAPGQEITGKTNLRSAIPVQYSDKAELLKYLLLEPGSGSGFVITSESNPEETAEWLPSLNDNGDRVLVSAIYDVNGAFLCGDALPVKVNVTPSIALTGMFPGQIINDGISIGTILNFSAAYIKYEFTNTDNGKIFTTTAQDPAGLYRWEPKTEFNGNVSVKAYAFDENDRSYESSVMNVRVQTQARITLNGISPGELVDSPVNLSASRNFEVVETEYCLLDPETGNELSLFKTDYRNFTWFPGTDLAGKKEVYVKAKGTDGTLYSSSPIPIIVSGNPKLLIQGIGPNQVLTTTGNGTTGVRLKAISNVPLKIVKFIASDATTGKTKILAELSDVTKEFTYMPTDNDSGKWRIKAIGTGEGGLILSSEEVPFTVYAGKIHPAEPLTDKSKFLGLASDLAIKDWRRSGMSAALQTAQSILETGWGQSVPVDKYNGRFSYNLFGIKGEGPAGSVISNTWEEYNGVSYRIDAKFRAYYNIAESWSDHNNLLMTKERYSAYRGVMYDSTLGAWALKRAGYATDSQYPVKLIKIITQYNLKELDRVSI